MISIIIITIIMADLYISNNLSKLLYIIKIAKKDIILF